MATPVAYYDAQGLPRDARGAVILNIGAPPGDIVGVMDGYEDDIETIYIKGNPIPQWDPLATKNNIATLTGPGFGAFALPDISALFKNYWLLIFALLMLSGAMMVRGRT